MAKASKPKIKAPKKAAPKKSSGTAAKRAASPAAKKSGSGRNEKAPSLRLDRIREQLLEELARLKKRLGVIQDDDSTSDNSDVGDIADVATSHETREILRELQSTEEEQLKQVQAALKRIENGTYGKCQRCGNPIESARLEALPHAPTCIACKRKEERGEFAKG